MIKVGYFADGPWAHNAFQKIVKDEAFKISFICVRSDSEDEVLRGYCQDYDIPYLRHKNVNSSEFLDSLRDFNVDIFVSMSFNQIFKEELINIPPLKTINCHAGKLPYYRGRNVLNWVLINDEKEFGVTVHYVDSGIDTGDIILQKTYPITDQDTYRTLLNIAHVACAEVLYEALCAIKVNSVVRVVQKDIHPVGMYCGIRKEGDELLNWNQTSREIFNFVRAISSPGPRATTFYKEHKVKINTCSLMEGAPIYKGNPGQILGKNGHGYLVKTQDSFVIISDIEANVPLRIGERLV